MFQNYTYMLKVFSRMIATRRIDSKQEIKENVYK